MPYGTDLSYGDSRGKVHRDLYLWPTHDQFYESVVNGTPGAPTHDAITNLRGYGTNYSLGAWQSGHVDPSGDLDKNVAGYTVNGFKFMPSSNVLGNMAEHMYDFWAGLNPHLEQVAPEQKKAAQDAFENAAALSVAAEGFNNLYAAFLKAQGENPARAGDVLGQSIRKTGIDLDSPKPVQSFRFGRAWSPMHQALADLKPLLKLLNDKADDPKWSNLRQAHDAVTTYLKGEPASLNGDELESRLMRLGVALFDCDGYGGDRRERQKAATQA
jgi:hypothetical protein